MNILSNLGLPGVTDESIHLEEALIVKQLSNSKVWDPVGETIVPEKAYKRNENLLKNDVMQKLKWLPFVVFWTILLLFGLLLYVLSKSVSINALFVYFFIMSCSLYMATKILSIYLEVIVKIVIAKENNFLFFISGIPRDFSKYYM